MAGNMLTARIDQGAGWVLIGSASDTGGPDRRCGAHQCGAPGIRFFKTSGSGAIDQYGFTDFQVTAR
jgi:hypothetical protein